jgi:hypothetical protein
VVEEVPQVGTQQMQFEKATAQTLIVEIFITIEQHKDTAFALAVFIVIVFQL